MMDDNAGGVLLGHIIRKNRGPEKRAPKYNRVLFMNPTAPHPLPLFKKKIINQVNKCCIE
jgi:hypothetical protein